MRCKLGCRWEQLLIVWANRLHWLLLGEIVFVVSEERVDESQDVNSNGYVEHEVVAQGVIINNEAQKVCRLSNSN